MNYINTKAEIFYVGRYFKSEVLPEARFPPECPRGMIGAMGVASPWGARGKTLYSELA